MLKKENAFSFYVYPKQSHGMETITQHSDHLELGESSKFFCGQLNVWNTQVD